MDSGAIREGLKPGKVVQIGFVVRNLSESVKKYEETIGIGPFMVFRFKPEKSFVDGRESSIDLNIGIARLSPELSIELIEVVSGETYDKKFLETHGEGILKLCCATDDYEGVLERAEKLKIKVLMSAETDVPGMGHVRAAYLDTYDPAGTFFEAIEVTPSK
jgi:methylmalonyl-CoA/ethylmalonyl-CoA epimerase